MTEEAPKKRRGVILEAVSGLMTGFAETIKYYRLWIELWTVIPLVEGLIRLWYHLDPRVYAQALRIRTITEGNADKKSNRYVILALYTPEPLPAFTQNIINAIERSPLNLIIVSNTKLEPLMRAQLLEKSILLIERANLGRDFGAYRDAINIALKRIKKMERLILLNDSLFYFERGLDKFVARLDGQQEFIGVTEVFQYHYHVQSFALSFGPRVLRNRRFLKFWKKYRPISTRRWSIHKGEVALTHRLTKAGFRPHILYQAADLIPGLNALPIREVLELVQLLPTYFRSSLYDEFDRILGGDGSAESLASIEAISEGVRPSRRGGGPPFLGNVLQQISDQAEAMNRWSFDYFRKKIVSTITGGNQMHVGGFLFVKYLNLPAIKRDIFYREVYSLEDIHWILTSFGEPVRDEAMADLRRAGTAAHLNIFLRLLFRHGSI
jgi:Rhamnan synthesis protein F